MGDADLAWDHSAGEHLMGADPNGSFRLDDSSVHEVLLHDEEEVTVDSGEHIRLSNNQLRYVLRGLEDAAILLRERQRTARRSRGNGGAQQQQRTEAASGGRQPGSSAFMRLRQCCCPHTCPSALQRHALAITCALQATMLLSVCVMEAVNSNMNPLSSQLVLAESALMMTIAPLCLLLNFCAAGQMVQQLISNEIRTKLLVSSYLGLIISFGGLYAAVFQVKDNSWQMQVPSGSPALAAEVYCRMLYLAVCISCLSSPAAVLPLQWYTYLLLSMQMLVGIVYFAAAAYHLLVVAVKRKHLDVLCDAPAAGRERLGLPVLNGCRSRATSQTSLLSRELLSVSGYGTMPTS